MKFYLSLLVFTLLGSNLFSQSSPSSYCGTQGLGEEKEYLLKEFQATLDRVQPAQPEITYYLPLVFHIVGTNGGEGYADLSLVLESVCALNDQYAGSGIQFYLERPPLYINNTNYYNHNFKDGNRMMNREKVGNRINIFLVQNAADNCGYYSPSADAIAVAKSCMLEGSTTLAHEIGHYLSLPHTFSGWEGGTPPDGEQERADGSNCRTAGDGFCDTRADYLADRWNCPYNGKALIDPVGDTVNPDETLIMSYSSDECQTRFSEEEEAAMRHYINQSKQGMVASEVPYYGPLSATHLLSPSLVNPFVNGSLSVFQWSKVPEAIGYQIQISRFFAMAQNTVDVMVEDTIFATSDLIPGVTYYCWVRPISGGNTCGDFSEKITFMVSQPTGLTSNPNEEMIQIYPNPLALNGVLNIETPQAGADIELMDLTGKILIRTRANGKLELALNGIGAGVYLLKIENAEGRWIRRVIIR